MTKPGSKPRPPEERFWPKVDKRGPNECWKFQGTMIPAGYGHFRIRPDHLELAHRAAWILTFGEIPNSLWVLHKCDNRLCCNPSHLFLGNHADNMADMVKKDRAGRTCGSRNGNAKLNESKVRKIRRLHATGNYTLQILGKMFNVALQTIHDAVRRKTWRWLDDVP